MVVICVFTAAQVCTRPCNYCPDMHMAVQIPSPSLLPCSLHYPGCAHGRTITCLSPLPLSHVSALFCADRLHGRVHTAQAEAVIFGDPESEHNKIGAGARGTKEMVACPARVDRGRIISLEPRRCTLCCTLWPLLRHVECLPWHQRDDMRVDSACIVSSVPPAVGTWSKTPTFGTCSCRHTTANCCKRAGTFSCERETITERQAHFLSVQRKHQSAGPLY